MNKLAVMTRLRRTIKKTLTNRKGQSTTEYILILAIVVMLATRMKSTLSGLLDAKVSALDAQITSF
jgi:hypothetical protein